MIALLLFLAPSPGPQVQSQPMAIAVGKAMPPAMDALINTKSRGGLADWRLDQPVPKKH